MYVLNYIYIYIYIYHVCHGVSFLSQFGNIFSTNPIHNDNALVRV